MNIDSLKNIDFNNLTPADHEVIGAALSEWAESDEFFESLKDSPLQPRNAESVARTQEILRAAGRGRPTLQAETQGHSPSIHTRLTPNLKERLTSYTQQQGISTSEAVRQALDSYLPQVA